MSIAVEWGKAPKTLPAQSARNQLLRRLSALNLCRTHSHTSKTCMRPHQHIAEAQAMTGHTVLGIVGGVNELDGCAVGHGQREDVQESQEADPAIVPAMKRECTSSTFLTLGRYLGSVVPC